MFNILNDVYSKFYNLSEELVINEIIVIFKGRVIFKWHIPKKSFDTKIYLLCDKQGYTYEGKVKSSSLVYNRRKTWYKRPFDKDPDKSWCYLHTSIQLF